MLKWNDGHAWPFSIYVGFEVKHKTNASKHMHLTSRFKLNLMRDIENLDHALLLQQLSLYSLNSGHFQHNSTY